MPATSSDVISDIEDALTDGDERYARELQREFEHCLSNRQKQEVKELFAKAKQ